MEQFIRGHTDVLKIYLMIIEEAEKAARPGEKNHFNRAYARYFALLDREFVVGQSPTFLFTRLVIRRLIFADVFKAISDYSSGKKGNPKFDHIRLFAGYIEVEYPDGICQGGVDNQNGVTYAIAINSPVEDEDELVLCPPFFDFPGIQKTIGEPGRA
jgi:hypothetical protein